MIKKKKIKNPIFLTAVILIEIAIIETCFLCNASTYKYGCDGVHFLPSSPYDAVFWICDQNNVDYTEMFWLLLNSACATSRPFLLLTLPLSQGVDWGWPRGWEGT